jgi:ADP-heptose:LPS heptosyltransferase
LIKTAFPHARIELLLAHQYVEALRYNPCVDEVLTIASSPTLRLRNYDLAFDFSPQHAFSLSSAIWTAWSGAKKKVGFDRGDERHFVDELVPVPTTHAHETANLAQLVRHVAGAVSLTPDSSLRTEWHFGPGEREEGEKIWKSWGLDQKSIALFLGARAEKQLPLDWFLELAQRLRQKDLRVVLMGGPAERSRLNAMSVPDGIVVAPELPLRPFAAAISHARAVVTADTGPMHVCVALGLPTVELFSHTETWRFGYGHIPGQVIIDSGGRLATVDEAWSALGTLLSDPRT